MFAGKIVATSVCIGFGFGGGVFSHALVIGAMLGGAYGAVFTQLFPGISSGQGAYTIVGMGAVAAAVLAAPISTTLIVFEMTGNYALTMAVMLAVVVASVMTQQIFGHSFFTAQLARCGFDVRDGVEMGRLRAITVASVMESDCRTVTLGTRLPELRAALQQAGIGELFVVDDDGALCGTITLAGLGEVAFDQNMDDLMRAGDVVRRYSCILATDDNLETALERVRESGEEHIPVVEDRHSMRFAGCLHERDLMNLYSKTLRDTRREEQGR